MFRHPVLKHTVAQHLDYMRTVQPPRHPDRQALACELVDHREQPQATAVVRARFDKIVAPDVIGSLGTQPDARSVVEPQPSSRLLFGRNLQPFPPPDTLHSIFANVPARFFEQRSNAPVAVAAVLTGQSDDRLRQPIFVVALRGLIALCPAWLAHQPARAPFTQSFFPSVMNGNPAPLGT